MAAKKKYQVFISSTYEDMKDERQAAVEAVLIAGHIPAGMELFSAGDDSQLEVIKRWIRDSDIYLLLLGARYGSIEPQSQRSYTEIEYDYATSIAKPHFALVLSQPAAQKRAANLKAKGVDLGDVDKMSTFRSKVLNKMSRPFDEPKDVKIYIPPSIVALEEKYSTELTGWIKGDEAVDSTPLVGQVSRLSEENQDLRQRLKSALEQIPKTPPGPPLAGLDDQFALEMTYTTAYNSQTVTGSIPTTWRKLFGLISPKLVQIPNDEFMQHYIAQQALEAAGRNGRNAALEEQTHNTVRIQLELLGLIKTEYSKSTAGRRQIFWHLTESGQQLMIELRAVRKDA